MKKIILLLTVSSLLIASCVENTEKHTPKKDKQKINQSEKLDSQETLFITKVSGAFSKVIQDKKNWSQLKNIFEDNIMMKDNTIKDDVLPSAYHTIRDDLIMDLTSLENIDLGGVRFKNQLIKEYNQLYNERITFKDIKTNLVKLHFAIPKIAFDNHDEWLKNGQPISLKAYDNSENSLEKLDKEIVIKTIGHDNYKKLVKAAGKESSSYYLKKSKNETFIIAGESEKGVVLSVKDNQSTVISFQINDEKYFNTITINSNDGKAIFLQTNLINQQYVYEPQNCKGFYVFTCGSDEMQKYRERRQAEADRTCETIWTCIPCCSSYGGIMYMTMIFQPKSVKCKKYDEALEVISFYSNRVFNNI
ncbi:MAG: hypothetical protein JXR05_10175 [Flavobacteriaceae bacterium]